MSGGGFSADWLRLRATADTGARDTALVRLLRQRRPAGGRWRVVDLGAGTGSNRRWLAPRLGGGQDWTLVDNDPALLARAAAPGVQRARRDLAAGLRRLDLGGADLVTASALLDLVSEAWLAELAERCRRGAPALLFALSYDGAIAWTPEEEGDETVRRLVNRHQRGDKGFGPALGPAAGRFAAGLLAGLGWRVRMAPSPWRLGPGDAALQAALLDGWAGAASEVAPGEAGLIAAWARRRHELIAARRSRLVVGHTDLLALPRGRPVGG